MLLELNRRSFIHMGLATGAAAIAPRWAIAQAAQTSPADRVAQMRAQAASTPIKTTKLYDNVYLLQGMGGNMAVQTGPQGRILIDSSYSTAVPHLLDAIKVLSSDPSFVLINTHWHIDHTDGNEGVHAAGFTIYAHEKTRKRLSEPSEIKLFGLSLPASPAAALPTLTFDDSMRIWHNGDSLDMAHFEPAHTDTDIYIHFHKADVLHVGDIFFNGMYPFIDESSGGSIGGMIIAAQKALNLAGDNTKIIPGHGPLGTKAEFQKYSDMLSTVRDKVAALKTAGASEKEVVAKKPTADLDATWGKGGFGPDMFVGIVYRTL
jgi:glyoxylase-like metal-dependent hydrolase (beta-lactamase superfamily II)